jgi:hypothetical protein
MMFRRIFRSLIVWLLVFSVLQSIIDNVHCRSTCLHLYPKSAKTEGHISLAGFRPTVFAAKKRRVHAAVFDLLCVSYIQVVWIGHSNACN